MNHVITQTNPKDLTFDVNNPRIAEFNLDNITSEVDIIRILWNRMDVEEIVLSIKASGFFEHEPLIAVEEEGKMIVIEGNRRLAAIKCINSPELGDYIGMNKNSLYISEEAKQLLKSIPVIFVSERRDAWKFIGFKHINGPAKWGSYAKAQYISLIRNEYNISLEQISDQIGDTHKTVRKLYQGLQVIEQAERKKKFSRGDINAPRLYFSHLYTGLSYEGIQDFIGLIDVSDEVSNPVPEEKLDNLELLLLWFFGSRKRCLAPMLLSQNPDLRRIEAVVKSKEAVYALKAGVSLSAAYELSQPKDETFERSLLEAKRALQKAQSFQSEGFRGEEQSIVSLCKTVADIAEELYKGVNEKMKTVMNRKAEQVIKTRAFDAYKE